MNKNFEKIFAKAKQEKRGCLIGFVTGMDPDYETSKQILIEMSKYCDAVEVGNPFNTSTSDSATIMNANMRAIKSGADTGKIFKLIKEVKSEIQNNIPFLIMGYMNPVYIYSIKKFARSCKESMVDGCIIVDSDNNAPEDKEIFEELSKIDVGYIKLIGPTNDESYIKQTLKKCSSFCYVFSYAGLTGAKQVNLENVKKSVKLIRKNSKIPIGVGFGIRSKSDVSKVVQIGDAAIVGSGIVEIIENGVKKKISGLDLTINLRQYLKELREGLSKKT
jgi:tryptophan synthase alpha chain